MYSDKDHRVFFLMITSLLFGTPVDSNLMSWSFFTYKLNWNLHLMSQTIKSCLLLIKQKMNWIHNIFTVFICSWLISNSYCHKKLKTWTIQKNNIYKILKKLSQLVKTLLIDCPLSSSGHQWSTVICHQSRRRSSSWHYSWKIYNLREIPQCFGNTDLHIHQYKKYP